MASILTFHWYLPSTRLLLRSASAAASSSAAPPAEDTGCWKDAGPAKEEVPAWVRIPKRSRVGSPLDGVRLRSDSNGYGSDIEEGVCSERRGGAKEPHHGLQ
ncbi:hypothetical protein CHARACLAT_026278, partial [Characodon lateralis]|nr:hypothetical protein [Characodon lateralis]